MLGRGAGEVDLELVSVDRHGRMDAELALDRLEDVVCLVASVGEPRDRRPDDPLGIGVELVHRGRHPLPAVARAELVDACAREPLGRELGAEVA